ARDLLHRLPRARRGRATRPVPDAGRSGAVHRQARALHTMSDEPAEPVEDAEKAYDTEQFAFVDEEAGGEVSGWLNFMNSRGGRRVAGGERSRERVVILGIVVALVALIGGVVLWKPWSSGPPADTGHSVLPSDRVSVLLQVQG